jgi:DNA-binding winged helix-turn-helix (wHTH) protein/TolB-like protein
MRPDTRVRFGPFDFDPETRELRRDGIPLRLQAQPAQVLAVLIDRAGQIVTREDLRQAVWGSDTYVDFESGLNYCIAQIRSALGDSADSARFIRTVPKRGYQFVAPLIAPVLAVDSATVAAPVERKRPAVRYAFIAGIILVASTAVVLLAFNRLRTVNIAVARFDNETGSAEMDSFTGGLTQAVVAELTATVPARYGIIGNAAVLQRAPRMRDLRAIGSALNARYVIVGQVQRNATHIRVLAHLIRVPQQTHVWVARYDRDVTDPLQTQSELARLIAGEFRGRLGSSEPLVNR